MQHASTAARCACRSWVGCCCKGKWGPGCRGTQQHWLLCLLTILLLPLLLLLFWMLLLQPGAAQGNLHRGRNSTGSVIQLHGLCAEECSLMEPDCACAAAGKASLSAH
jgi:hypothetical protein